MKRWFSFNSKPKSKEELKLIRFIMKKFGYRPQNLSLFQIALTHKSVANISKDLESNERLEFLGDTILDAIVADYLYQKFPEKDEGYLTKLKSKIVNRKTLNGVAIAMELDEYILHQKGRGIQPTSLSGNAFEAIIGAIYIDGGYETVKKSFYHSVMRNYIDLPTLLEKEIDFKSQLYILAQRNKLNIEYRTTKEELIDGEWRYEIEVYINSSPFGRGKGNTKKIAEQIASKETLELIGLS